ncbi:MAG: amidohydrolase [Saprospiraceae bacterium]
MRLSIVQTKLHWENPEANLGQLATMLDPLAGQTDLVILPEMFSTGFSMNASKLAEGMDGTTVSWMRGQAAHLNAVVCGSFICSEHGNYYNRFVWMQPDGEAYTYDKRHLFSLAEEHRFFTAGSKRLVVDWKGFRVCPMICYDLRFPVWARQEKGNPYDLLLYVANWPRPRAHHWRAMLHARAIENQCYVAGVNIVGSDGNKISYQGDSSIIGFGGEMLCQMSETPGVFTTQLSLESLKNYRTQLAFLADADDFEIKL